MRFLVVGESPSRAQQREAERQARTLEGRRWVADALRPFAGLGERRVARLLGVPLWALDTLCARANALGANPGKADGKGDAFPGADNLPELHRRLAKLRATFGRYHLVVALGWRVARVLGVVTREPDVDDPRAYGTISRPAVGLPPVLVLPHPSGTNHFWNDAGAVDALRAQVAERLEEHALLHAWGCFARPKAPPSAMRRMQKPSHGRRTIKAEQAVADKVADVGTLDQ